MSADTQTGQERRQTGHVTGGASVRVNLLPREIEQRRAARRVSLLSALGVVLFVAVLGSLYFLKIGELSDAQEAQEQVRAEVARLEAQVAELEQYKRLAEELEARNALLATAMGPEVSFARVLNDLSLGFPTSSSLRTLTANVDETTPAGAGEPAVMNLTFNGYSVERFAPGVETVVVEFDRVATFFNAYVTQAQEEVVADTDVVGFQGALQLGEDARTGRYTEGLPEGVPQ